MIHKLTLDIRSFLLVISLVAMPIAAFANGWGVDALGCHNNRKMGGYHCHQGGGSSSSSLGSLKPSINEDFYNMASARKLNGKTEATHLRFVTKSPLWLPHIGWLSLAWVTRLLMH